ncbi:hypothetical protein J2T56_003271 [Natronobacillus azotifigens]|uniref:Uncharacterized protein n=1 Tax=Natronobacillus azotifigens TaxID=472978 RepID=A0A9J6RGY3_9BACI|nr:hypothetical protein [Natronobacillus azotifigens]MCZ0704660.1 hypothetical protein [Natronobacillus azotifigens]
MVITILVLIIFFIIFYLLNKEWYMIQMKRGNENPITWQSHGNGSFRYIDDDILVIEIEDKQFETLDITITDLFHLPNLEEIHLGLWYDTEKYDDEFIDHIFHLVLEDEQNNRYDNNSYSIGEKGMFGQFQRRQISDVSLIDIEELYLYIYPLKEVDGEIVQLEPEKRLVFTEDMELEHFE